MIMCPAFVVWCGWTSIFSSKGAVVAIFPLSFSQGQTVKTLSGITAQTNSLTLFSRGQRSGCLCATSPQSSGWPPAPHPVTRLPLPSCSPLSPVPRKQLALGCTNWPVAAACMSLSRRPSSCQDAVLWGGKSKGCGVCETWVLCEIPTLTRSENFPTFPWVPCVWKDDDHNHLAELS